MNMYTLFAVSATEYTFARLSALIESRWATDRAEVFRRAYELSLELPKDARFPNAFDSCVDPLKVARLAFDVGLDLPSVCVGLLCRTDVVAATSRRALTVSLGNEISHLAERVTRLLRLQWPGRDERQDELFRRMLVSVAGDVRALLVALCGRVTAMRNLATASPDVQRQLAVESLRVYAPLMGRIGFSQEVKAEFEDLAFMYLLPNEYRQLIEELKSDAERQQYAATLEGLIAAEMSKFGVSCRVVGRAKHLWSIYEKMRKTGRALEEVLDKVGIRVIVTSNMACYMALGVIHQTWTPLPGAFADYIAIPKRFLYQSIHTKVLGPHGAWVEIQIRSEEMHSYGESCSPHWAYKEGLLDARGDVARYAALRRLASHVDSVEDRELNPFHDRVIVFTPNEDIKSLPRGSGVIDFSYSIHTEVGDRSYCALVNGRIVPLHYVLGDGDVVEIVTRPSARPKSDWLSHARSAHARKSIRRFLRRDRWKEDLALAALGKDLLRRALRKAHPSLFVIGEGNINVFVAVAHHGCRIHLSLCCAPSPGVAICGDFEDGSLVVHRRGCGRQKPHSPMRVDVGWLLG